MSSDIPHQGNSLSLAIAIVGPSLHQCPTLLQCISSPVCLFGSVADNMRQRSLCNLPREMRFVADPVAKARPKTVHGRILDFHAAQEHFHGHIAQGTARLAPREDEVAGADLPHL